MNLVRPAGWAVVITSLLAAATQGEESAEPRQGSVPAVVEFLNSVEGVKLGKRLQIQSLQNDDLKRVFDQCEFLLLRYPRFPVEVVPVEPLRPNNLFAVCAGKVTRISEDAQLKDFFLQHFPVSVDAEMRLAGVRAWLRLVQELHQDGFVRFESPSMKTGGLRFEGVVKATEGSGEGKLRVLMEFTDGKLSKLDSEGKIIPGTRRLR